MTREMEMTRETKIKEGGDREIKICTSRMKDISNLADTVFTLGDSVREQATHLK